MQICSVIRIRYPQQKLRSGLFVTNCRLTSTFFSNVAIATDFHCTRVYNNALFPKVTFLLLTLSTAGRYTEAKISTWSQNLHYISSPTAERIFVILVLLESPSHDLVRRAILFLVSIVFFDISEIKKCHYFHSDYRSVVISIIPRSLITLLCHSAISLACRHLHLKNAMPKRKRMPCISQKHQLDLRKRRKTTRLSTTNPDRNIPTNPDLSPRQLFQRTC